jgi:hypothetical protein
MKKGSLLICKETICNSSEFPIFLKGIEYKVIYVDNEDVRIKVCISCDRDSKHSVIMNIEEVHKKFKIK